MCLSLKKNTIFFYYLMYLNNQISKHSLNSVNTQLLVTFHTVRTPAFKVTSVMSCSSQHYGLWPIRLLCPWDFSGKNTGGWAAVPSSRGSSRPRDQTHVLCLLHCQAGSLPLVPPGKSKNTNLIHSKQNLTFLLPIFFFLISLH